MKTKTYYLEPDFRKDPLKGKTFCVRCQKALNPKDAVLVTVNWDTWQVSEGGSELMGKDCWKKIKKDT